MPSEVYKPYMLLGVINHMISLTSPLNQRDYGKLNLANWNLIKDISNTDYGKLNLADWNLIKDISNTSPQSEGLRESESD